MRDNRDPTELYKSILATQKHFGCSIIEAADRVEAMRDDLITNGRNSYDGTGGGVAAIGSSPSEPPTERRCTCSPETVSNECPYHGSVI